jgi:hypothetical protein
MRVVARSTKTFQKNAVDVFLGYLEGTPFSVWLFGVY